MERNQTQYVQYGQKPVKQTKATVNIKIVVNNPTGAVRIETPKGGKP